MAWCLAMLAAEDAVALLSRELADRVNETVAVAFLDAKQQPILITCTEHENSEASLPARKVLADALWLDAVAIVIAHNHPSGDPRPSAADLAATRRLAETAASMGVRLLDHLIFAGGQYCSLRGLGLL